MQCFHVFRVCSHRVQYTMLRSGDTFAFGVFPFTTWFSDAMSCFIWTPHCSQLCMFACQACLLGYRRIPGRMDWMSVARSCLLRRRRCQQQSLIRHGQCCWPMTTSALRRSPILIFFKSAWESTPWISLSKPACATSVRSALPNLKCGIDLLMPWLWNPFALALALRPLYCKD